MQLIGKYITAVSFNDDIGVQNGPLISPDVCKKLNKPQQREFCAKIKDLATEAKLVLHTSPFKVVTN